MLSRIYQWRPIRFRPKSQFLIPNFSLLFTKPSVSAANIIYDDEPSDPIREILNKASTSKDLLGNHCFRTLIPTLSSLQIDHIIGNLGVDDPDSAIDFFYLLRNEYGFRGSRVSQFVIAHLLAGKGRLKEVCTVFRANAAGRRYRELLESSSSSIIHCGEACLNSGHGFHLSSGSASSLSELLENSFRAWDSNASILTYNSLLYNLRHTDIMWDIYEEIKASGTPQSTKTNSIVIDGLCGQSLLPEAVAFLQENEGKESKPCIASFNTLMSRFCKVGYIDVAKSFFCMMFKYGLLPDAYSYNILIHGLCTAGSMEEALEFTNDMERHGVHPDVVTYNILAKGFRLLGMMSGAWKIIRQMLLKGLNPDVVTYKILSCGHCQIGNIEEGFALREEMLSQGFQLNDISYSGAA
ncbi:tetratricopeptide repeat (TPR)-like superfamily protein [Actinidia rufa]|uniref:Tetratricopeptide repeat (TPR)-like superfamily protein n=1 Tax=Actinidia rufa TaxID=165716 RepID=A0A7J0FP56_9ERIC|nr:tetratricopeptide repeat (TPR)-like superfamily protein [Actinidia rufa]